MILASEFEGNKMSKTCEKGSIFPLPNLLIGNLAVAYGVDECHGEDGMFYLV